MKLERNPYYTIWFRPSATIRQILISGKRFEIRIPIVLSAISGAVGTQQALLYEFGGGPAAVYWLITVAFGYISLMYVMPWLIHIAGSPLGGKGNFRKIQLVVGLSQIPAILSLTMQVPHLVVSDLNSYHGIHLLMQFLVWIFYLRILISGLSIIQKYPYGFAVVNLVLILLPMILIRLMIG